MWLLQQDLKIWYLINTVWTCGFLDAVMPFLRNQNTWAPLYLFLLLFMPLNFKKAGWAWIIGFLFCFALADYGSASILKPIFHRTRPCGDARLQEFVRILVSCGSGKSFPSSHAANHFALGTFMAITLYRRFRKAWILPLVWAFVVSYAQVYVGVHFPADIVFGGLYGGVIGMLGAWLFHRRFSIGKQELPVAVG